ncbi:MAG: hypothetical protein JWR61_3389 [Ferruginibacter sp.]|uniref:hypothetical protein n=1 Tax=Ferruginibacter sp. TaxID=1940288 RepID=UPI00265A7DEC|nr:hypothetical protein [Ferruginibacter sp.]MDB5278434.1 hypothetical protein [Ferruginibacter sp.]
MKCDILIAVLSWEERYIKGLVKSISEYNPDKVLLFKYDNPLTAEWKMDNYKMTKQLLGDKLVEVEIKVQRPEENWFIFLKIFHENCKGKKVVLDSTTMTREAIWLCLYNCKINGCQANYIYYTPNDYSGDWISRDPGKPRLLYKMSGIAKLGAPTLLLVTTGFDLERLDSLIYCFEPKLTMVFLPNSNNERNRENSKRCKDLLKRKYNIELFYEYSPYDTEASFKLILEKLQQAENGGTDSYLDTHNIIFNSLGAKTSAITLFNIWLKYPQVALSYIPSKEYNKEYSTGIGESYRGKIEF